MSGHRENKDGTPDRIVTYPADMVIEVADRLCDLDYSLPGDRAEEIAYDIVIDVTLAVDKLREAERSA